MTDLSGPQILDRIFSIIHIYWNLLLLVITRFLIYSAPSLLWLAFTRLFIIALKKNVWSPNRFPDSYTSRETRTSIYPGPLLHTCHRQRKNNIYINTYNYNIHTCTNRLYAVLTDQFSFRTAFVQNARGQFSTFIVAVGTYLPVRTTPADTTPKFQILRNHRRRCYYCYLLKRSRR